MKTSFRFDEDVTIRKLRHYLPEQAPLKDFIHHNTLHAFQHEPFEQAIRRASKIFGFKTSLNLAEYQALYQEQKISKPLLERVIISQKGTQASAQWMQKCTEQEYDASISKLTGRLRKYWKSHYHIDLDTIVHTNLFRILNSYLDQGIAVVTFPVENGGLLSALRTIEKNTYFSFFKTKRAKNLLFDESVNIYVLLQMLVGDESYFEQYLFDQQFAHPGWSGMVSVVEEHPQFLLEYKNITLADVIHLELLLEIDNLDQTLGKRWQPLVTVVQEPAIDVLNPGPLTELDEVLNLWQAAYEWSYYDEVLGGIKHRNQNHTKTSIPSFQAFFCIDDRECSIRRYVEQIDHNCTTYGTPGFFGIDTYYQPENGKFHTKICPAPVKPKHLIKEVSTVRLAERDVHFSKSTHGLLRSSLISQTLGFWSALKLSVNIFKPSLSPATTYSFRHMDKLSSLTVENKSPSHMQDGLQVGYTVDEMTNRVEAVLKSTGLVANFAPLVYMFGHGASSVNNTHYAGYDCGACSGRPGSVNARAFSFMANHPMVRQNLVTRGIAIPTETEFVGALHDTTRDEVMFYDEQTLSPANAKRHALNLGVFEQALDLNAKERSRRFMSINTELSAKKVHQAVKLRSVSLFEPRPELNHATNTLCIIGRRSLNGQLFLDRRAFLNSYDYRVDPEGKFLLGILNAAAPVCGGINLEYYFSRVDNEKLGAGSKLPHNVMGLIGVANGFDGDLRTGLPLQMIEIHDPLRLMVIVEHYPEVVLNTIKTNPATYEWFDKNWVMLAVENPDTKEILVFKNGEFLPYEPLATEFKVVKDATDLVETTSENLPVYEIQ